MIGKVTLADADGPVDIVLEDDGTLHCEARSDFAQSMTQIFQHQLNIYAREYSEARGPWGVKPLHDFARQMHGKVEIEPKQGPKSQDGKPIIY